MRLAPVVLVVLALVLVGWLLVFGSDGIGPGATDLPAERTVGPPVGGASPSAPPLGSTARERADGSIETPEVDETAPRAEPSTAPPDTAAIVGRVIGVAPAGLRAAAAPALPTSAPALRSGNTARWAGVEVPLGADGGYVLEGLPPEQQLHLQVWSASGLLHEVPFPIVLEAGERRALDVVPVLGLDVTGSLRDSDGVGLPGVELSLLRRTTTAPLRIGQMPAARTVTTGPDGSFTVPDLQPGGWQVGVEPGEHAVQSVNFRVAEGAERVSIELVAHVGLVIRGQLVDEQGEPIPGEVRASIPFNPLVPDVTVRTDEVGRFVLGPLLPRTYSVRPLAGDEPLLGAAVEAAPGADDIVLELSARD